MARVRVIENEGDLYARIADVRLFLAESANDMRKEGNVTDAIVTESISEILDQLAREARENMPKQRWWFS